MGELHSQFIVGYYDSFIEGTCINIIMEYCQYGDLQSYLSKQTKPLIDNAIWKTFIHISLGLYYLHSNDIIHRDMKTLNLLVAKDVIVKIGDLGAA